MRPLDIAAGDHVFLLDTTMSSDPNQVAQSSPQVQLYSSEVPSDPIFDNTNVV